MFWNLFKKNEIKHESAGKRPPPTPNPLPPGINFLQSMQKLDMKDGDIIVLRHPCVLSEEAGKNICFLVREIAKKSGVDVKVMILEEGMNIGVLRKEVS